VQLLMSHRSSISGSLGRTGVEPFGNFAVCHLVLRTPPRHNPTLSGGVAGCSSRSPGTGTTGSRPISERLSDPEVCEALRRLHGDRAPMKGSSRTGPR
jgi:hypothetical protein